MMRNLFSEVSEAPVGATQLAPHLNLSGPQELVTRVTGRFYTHELIGRHLGTAMLRAKGCASSDERLTDRGTVRLIDPFCGDGRLARWLLEEAAREARWRGLLWQVHLWDCDVAALAKAQIGVQRAAGELGLRAEVFAQCGDSFSRARTEFGGFDFVVTNPPWEVLKPDRRELETLDEVERQEHIARLRGQAEHLSELYSLSVPTRRYSGWGVNLARCGVEAALRLTAPEGVCGVVSPASLLADQMSVPLRRWIFREFTLHDLAHYEAEARLFERVDQPCLTLVVSPNGRRQVTPRVSVYGKDRQRRERASHAFDPARLESGEALSFFADEDTSQLFARWKGLSTFAELEGRVQGGLWAGRELDETGITRLLCSEGRYRFVKGRMVARFGMAEQPSAFVAAHGPSIPPSADFERLTWRDVSRPTQKRRVHATLIPPGWVSGNSLHVAYFRDNDPRRLRALLAIVSSFVFEAQVRARLATAHVSLGAVRAARVLPLSDAAVVEELATLSDGCLSRGAPDDFFDLEAGVAQLYGLSRDDFATLLASFEKLEKDEVAALLDRQRWAASAHRAIPISA